MSECLPNCSYAQPLALIAPAPAALDAQAHLEPWYEHLGFRRSGEVSVDDGIPHVPMTLRAEDETQGDTERRTMG